MPLYQFDNEGEAGYLNLARDIMTNGVDVLDRTGVGTRGVFGRQLRFDLTNSFPLLTSKRIHKKSIIVELLWFLRGETNVRWLQERGVSIWDEWADEDGELGPVYGKQWRNWEHVKLEGAFLSEVVSIDQISNVLDSLRNNPHSRRHIVSAWNPAEIESMKLPPCHCLFQFYVRPLTLEARQQIADSVECWTHGGPVFSSDTPQEERERLLHADLDKRARNYRIPRYYLDCQLYQRSANERLH